MYATSHKVRASAGIEAVHSFLHQHGEIPWPRDVSGWPESQPGRLVAQRNTLPVGGNSVTAYLDVLAPDGTPVRDLEETLGQLAEDIAERRNPTLLRRGSVTVRFGVQLSLEPRRDELLSELRAQLTELLRDELLSPPAPASQDPPSAG